MKPVQTSIPSRESLPNSDLTEGWKTARQQYQVQDYAAASESLIELLAHLPKGEVSNRCRLYLASSQLMLQHTGDAIPVLLQIELGSRYAYEARYLLGLAYWKKGNTEQAQRQWEALTDDRYAGAWQAAAERGLKQMEK
jgi:TolA-binding protein